MSRPLVWVGVAYIIGSAWAALDGSPVTLFWIIGIAVLATGRIRQLILKNWLFWILPVFCLSGYVVFGSANTYPCDDWFSNEKITVNFEGVIASSEEGEYSIAVTVTDEKVVTLEDKIEVISSASSDNQREKTKVGLLIYIDKGFGKWDIGDYIAGTGEMEKLQSASNPGQFDAASYYHAKGIDYAVRAKNVDLIEKAASYRILLQEFRTKWVKTYKQFLDIEDTGVMDAILMGDKQSLDKEIKKTYQQVGIVHVLAISGLHISIVGMGIYEALRKLGLGLKSSSCISGFLVLSYGVMAGFGVSTQRAVIMFIIRMGAVYLGYSYDLLSALALSALIILIRHPLAITQAGIQFSFMAVLSIAILWPAMRKLWIQRDVLKANGVISDKQMERIINIFGSSAAVTIGTLPLSAYYYGALPLISLFLNLIVLPIMGILVPIGLMTGLSGLVMVPLGRFLAGSIHYILLFNTILCKWAARVPFAIWRTGVPPLSWVFIYYGILIVFLLLAFYDQKLLKYAKVRMLFGNGRKILYVLVLCSFILMPYRKMSSMAAFLDIGQGDCIFMRTPSGHTWLIDGGSTDEKNIGEYKILPFLNYYGEDEIDYACISHGDEDHLSGIRELLEMDKIRNLVLTETARNDSACMELAEIANAHHRAVSYIGSGDVWDDGGWQFECISPEKDGAYEEDGNDSSMVLRIQTDAISFLMTGDISEKVEKKLPEEKIKDIDVLKVAHHGSGSSSSLDFLNKTGAKLAIISCGKGNRYGHPADETLERIKEAGMNVGITMDKGAILMLINNGRVKVKTWK